MTPYAKVEIKDGQVYSSQYDDIYYSGDDGAAESEYVFLGGNDLPARWRKKSRFCIVETGFGTGLNFLVTLNAWIEDPTRCASLDYFAIEAHPLRAVQLSKIHTHWPDLKSHSQILVEQYPGAIHGCHTLNFEAGRVQLHLVFETLETALNSYELNPDSWFLDGFAPSKNPSMWNKENLHKIAALSRPGTSLSTFTAAGKVRRNLIEAGFEISKRTGFGRKREMLCGFKTHAHNVGTTHNLIKHSPWFAAPQINDLPRNIAIIGAGIAGAQAAWHLAQRGMKVVVVEALEKIAGAASGNKAGVLAPKLTSSANEGEAFYLAAFLYQLSQLHILKQQGFEIAFAQQGLMQLAHNRSVQRRFEKITNRDDLPDTLLQIVSAEYASGQLGEPVEQPCLLIKQAGSLSSESLCKALLSHPNIELRLSTRVNNISHHHGCPALELSTGELLSVDALVLANGYRATQLTHSIQILPVRGQSSSAKVAANLSPAHVIGHAGYVVNTPRIQSGAQTKQELIFGASYERGDCNVDLRAAETRQNLDTLKAYLPKLAGRLAEIKSSHAGVRATTLDRWPIVGPLANADFYQTEYKDLHQGKRYKSYPEGHYQRGVYILSGLGSRGLSSAAYCGNLLAHMILGTSPPAPARTLHALHPARFIIRNLRKNRKII